MTELSFNCNNKMTGPGRQSFFFFVIVLFLYRPTILYRPTTYDGFPCLAFTEFSSTLQQATNQLLLDRYKVLDLFPLIHPTSLFFCRYVPPTTRHLNHEFSIVVVLYFCAGRNWRNVFLKGIADTRRWTGRQ